jgi:predicted DsbA family dithiol-disulfide isomerase
VLGRWRVLRRYYTCGVDPLRLDVWSDIACPWCYIGRHRLAQAVREFNRPVTVVWRSFELDPAAPRTRETAVSHVHRLSNKYGVSERQAQAMIDRVVTIGRDEGIEFDFDRIRPGNSFDAHRLLQLARSQDLELAATLAERLFRGYFAEGLPIGDPRALIAPAVEVGLDADQVAAVLGSDAHADDVRADEDEAAGLGIDGVPFFVVDGRYGVAGAQPPELLREVFTRALGAAATEVSAGA